MAVLFISHSSKDDAAASALEAWLRRNGFTDVFLDHDSIVGGDKWREELRASAAACRVVVCLVTDKWLGSDECFGEFVAAAYTMGRRIIPLFLQLDEPTLAEAAERRLAKVRSEDQGINLDTCLTAAGVLDLDQDHNVAERLKNGLRAAGALSRVGLDPEAFAIDRKLRPTPFPGLSSFGDADADAALFYGRSREIALVLEELRKMRAEGDLRPFVILGASGAGKSSLLKAGVIPRLRRERPAWLPLRTFRPGADPLLNFADAIARSLADFGQIEASGVVRDRLQQAWMSAARDDNREPTTEGIKMLEAALEAERLRLRAAAGTPGATILVSVDQAEEIARADGQSGDILSDYLRAALSATASKWLVACTVRTDSFPELQSHRRFRGLEARSFDLRAMQTFRFDSVVEQPARRYGVEIEPALVDQLIKDIPNEDALPLLAFALQRLWGQFAGSGSLTHDHYDTLGGLKGLIEDAAERALPHRRAVARTADDRRQPVARPIRRQQRQHDRSRCAGGIGPECEAARAGDHREPAARRQRPDHDAAARAERDGRGDRAGRFRQRLFEPQLPVALQLLQAQDRPQLHASLRRRGRPRRVGRKDHHRAGPPIGYAGHGRRCRDRPAVGLPGPGQCRPGAGIPVRSADAGHGGGSDHSPGFPTGACRTSRGGPPGRRASPHQKLTGGLQKLLNR
jgi:hypothetical protein